jgi:hypothetical protein
MPLVPLIPLEKRSFATVDDCDFGVLMNYRWRYHKGVVQCSGTGSGSPPIRVMSRFILGISDDRRVRCVDGNPLNLRRANLSVVSFQQWMVLLRERNRRFGVSPEGRALLDHFRDTNARRWRLHGRPNSKLNTSSEYRGVVWDKNQKRWQASLTLGGINHYIGQFSDEKTAAIAVENVCRAAILPDGSISPDWAATHLNQKGGVHA